MKIICKHCKEKIRYIHNPVDSDIHTVKPNLRPEYALLVKDDGTVLDKKIVLSFTTQKQWKPFWVKHSSASPFRDSFL